MEEKTDNSWVRNTLILGGLIGALTGVGMAYLMVQRAKERQERLQIGPGEGIRLGMMLLGLLRSVGELGGKKK
jgi:hypothetical protein